MVLYFAHVNPLFETFPVTMIGYHAIEPAQLFLTECILVSHDAKGSIPATLRNITCCLKADTASDCWRQKLSFEHDGYSKRRACRLLLWQRSLISDAMRSWTAKRKQLRGSKKQRSKHRHNRKC